MSHLLLLLYQLHLLLHNLQLLLKLLLRQVRNVFDIVVHESAGRSLTHHLLSFDVRNVLLRCSGSVLAEVSIALRIIARRLDSVFWYLDDFLLRGTSASAF